MTDPSPANDRIRIGTPIGDAVLKALRQVPKVVRSESARTALVNEPEKYAQEAGLPTEAGPVLLSIVNAAAAVTQSRENSKGGEPTNSPQEERTREVRAMLMQPFGHITWSFRILTGMSVMLFLVGLTFLLVALAKAVNEQSVSTATLTIAGVGLADFLLLFYKRPWEDIARGLSNSQQARIIAISYLSGISMVTPNDPNRHLVLKELTRDAVALSAKLV